MVYDYGRFSTLSNSDPCRAKRICCMDVIRPLVRSAGPWPARLAVSAILVCAFVLPSAADCNWTFNWYCPDCSKINARTTGTVGPFSSESSCDSARSSWERRLSEQGGGGTTGSCTRHGICEEPSHHSSTDTSGSGNYPRSSSTQPRYTPPAQYDSGNDPEARAKAQATETPLRDWMLHIHN